MATKAQRAFQIRMERMMQRIERPFAKAIAREKNRYINQFIRDFKLGFRASTLLQEHRSNIATIIEFYISKAVELFGKHQRNALKARQLKLVLKQEEVDIFKLATSAYMFEWGFNNARDIANTTQRDVQRILIKFSNEPITQDELILELQGIKSLTIARAVTIARTETHAASQFAVWQVGNFIERELETELVKAWIHVTDERTRASHAAVKADNFISIHDKFNVGGEQLMFPGDPSGSPANIINCRCVMIQEERE